MPARAKTRSNQIKNPFPLSEIAVFYDAALDSGSACARW
jgi:hypothetical protein